MTIRADWDPAPAGQVLAPGACRAMDEDSQGCTHGFIHLGPHQRTGLRAWLEVGQDRAIIRSYEAVTADGVEAMERPLFAHFGFEPIARQDLARAESGGLNPTWVMFVGLLAPSEKLGFHLRLVCFARADQIGGEGE